MAFPSNPVEGQSYTENNTVWIYSAVTGQWNRSVISQVNETTYIGADGAPSGIGGDTQVIFNSNGSFAGDSGLTYNKTTDALTSGSLKVTSLGTAAAPAISVTGDPNTGIYSPGADQVAVATNGTARLRVDNNGDVQVSTNNAVVWSLNPSTNFLRLWDTFSNGVDIGASGRISFQTGGSERLRITSDGKVGIGTSSPSSNLHVSTSSGSEVGFVLENTAATSRMQFNSTGGGGNVFMGSKSNGFVIQTSGSSFSDKFFITAAGNVGIGTTSPSSPLHVEGNILANKASGNTGITAQSGSILCNISSQDGVGHFVYGTGAYPLTFSTNATERARIDSSGRVGIGTTSPSAALDVQTSSSAIANLSSSNASGGYIVIGKTGSTSLLGSFNAGSGGGSSINADALYFRSAYGIGFNSTGGGGVVNACLDTSGRFLVGTSSSITTYQTPGIQVHSTSDNFAGASFTCYQNTIYSGNINFGKSRGTSVGSFTAVQSGDQIGGMFFNGADGTNFVPGAEIRAYVDGTPGTNDMPGRLVFSTTADGASFPTERMRITSTGQVRLAGAGITFNGDTAAANELDDYEEGTFTPTIAGSTTTGVGTYTVQSGKYVKVGGKVHVEVAMTWTAHTGTGGMWFAGLPFTSAATGNGPGVSLGRVSNIALTANNILLAYVTSNSTIAPLRQYPVGGGAEATVPIDTAGEVNFSATYMVV